MIDLARAGTCRVDSANVALAQRSSAQIHRPLHQTTSTAPAIGMSRTRWRVRDGCGSRSPRTPGTRRFGRHDHNPPTTSGGLDRVDHAVSGQVEKGARSITLRDRRLAHHSWSLPWWISSQHPSQCKATSPSAAGSARHLHTQPRRAGYAPPKGDPAGHWEVVDIVTSPLSVPNAAEEYSEAGQRGLVTAVAGRAADSPRR